MIYLKQLARLVSIFIVLTAIVASKPASADVFNKIELFGKFEACEGYHDFLQGDINASKEGCHKLAAFLIEANQLELLEFLSEAANLSGPNSSFGALARTLEFVVWGNEIKTYTWSEVAGIRFSNKMSEASDTERAVLYSYLLSEIRRYAVVSMCKREAACEDLEPLNSINEIIGSGFSQLDKVRADYVLLCLLRADGFQVPVRKVLDSRVFDECIQTPR